MKLKCIGGYADGKEIEVANSYRDNELVKVPAKLEYDVTKFNINIAIKDSIIVSPYHFYKIQSLHNINNGHKTTIKYLIPEKWDYWEALIYLFNSHHNAS